MSLVSGERRYGRLGNQIVRCLAVSRLAKKHNLYVRYGAAQIINSIGFELYSGTNIHNKTIVLNDNNYFLCLNNPKFFFNVDSNRAYFQTKKLTDLMHSELNKNINILNFIKKNKYNKRYNKNNDCFVHIRLGDVSHWNPGFEYYDGIISKLEVDNIYVATDSNNHEIINKLKNKYKNLKLMGNNLVEIFKFGSTCKYVVLSYGTFSALIGYISFFSTVY